MNVCVFLYGHDSRITSKYSHVKNVVIAIQLQLDVHVAWNNFENI